MSQMNQDTNNGSRKAHTLYITELERPGTRGSGQGANE